MPDLIALAERLTNQAPRELSAWQTELMLEAAAALREAHGMIERLSLADAEDVAEVERLKSELTSTQADARTLSAEVERLRGLLKEARKQLEWWTPDESNVTEDEASYLDLWFALRDSIDAELGEKHD